MIVDTALRVSLRNGDTEVDVMVAQTPEGAVELTVEMLRRHKRLFPGDTLVVERLDDFVKRQPTNHWRKEMQT